MTFRPYEVHRWRQAVARDPALRESFLGRRLDSAVIRIKPQADGLLPRVDLGRLRPPSRVFGEPENPRQLDGVADAAVTLPRRVTRTFPEARIVGTGAWLDADGTLHTPHHLPPRDAADFLAWNASGHQGYLAETVDGKPVIRFETAPKPERIDLQAVFFPNIEPENYGSFLTRQLAPMLACAEEQTPADCYVVSGRPSWLGEAFSLFGLPPGLICSLNDVCGATFRSVTVHELQHAEGFTRPETRWSIRRLVERIRAESGAEQQGRKLYVSRLRSKRRAPDYRPLMNEEEVQALACSRGFTPIVPEWLSFRDQIATFAAASHIVGPSGSGMLNAMFTPPGARVVDLEGVSDCARQHAKVYASAGHDYAFVFGSTCPDDPRLPGERRWTVPVNRVAEALDWMLS